MTGTESVNRKYVTDAISVSCHGSDTVHLNIHSHLKEGEFLTSALLLSRAQAKDLAAALTELTEMAESKAVVA